MRRHDASQSLDDCEHRSFKQLAADSDSALEIYIQCRYHQTGIASPSLPPGRRMRVISLSASIRSSGSSRWKAEAAGRKLAAAVPKRQRQQITEANFGPAPSSPIPQASGRIDRQR